MDRNLWGVPKDPPGRNRVQEFKSDTLKMTENQIQFVNLEVVKELLATQEIAFRSSLQLFLTDIRDEVRSVGKDLMNSGEAWNSLKVN